MNQTLEIAYDSAPDNEGKWFESVFMDAYNQVVNERENRAEAR